VDDIEEQKSLETIHWQVKWNTCKSIHEICIITKKAVPFVVLLTYMIHFDKMVQQIDVHTTFSSVKHFINENTPNMISLL